MEEEQIASVGTTTRRISLRPDTTDQWILTIDGRPCKVDARQLASNLWSFIVDGRSYIVVAEFNGEASSHKLLVGANRVQVTIADALHTQLRSAKFQHQPDREVVRAPIAGKVVRVAKEVGATVDAGDALIVLEAMKMENELVCERAGTVKVVHVASGDVVEVGDVLVTLGARQNRFKP